MVLAFRQRISPKTVVFPLFTLQSRPSTLSPPPSIPSSARHLSVQATVFQHNHLSTQPPPTSPVESLSHNFHAPNVTRTILRGHRPKRIILMRHGESMGNVDENLYATVPDNQMPLSDAGRLQSLNAGRKLKEIVGDEKIKFFVSPYKRTKETFQQVSLSFRPDQISFREEPRLREQDFGNFQNTQEILRCRQERKVFGSFYYRFPEGESGADVFDRVSTFIETLHREFVRESCPPNFVLITHGITARLFLMRYFHWEVEKFERLFNLNNCQIVPMLLQPNGSYILGEQLGEHPKDDELDNRWTALTTQITGAKQAPKRMPTFTDLYDL